MRTIAQGHGVRSGGRPDRDDCGSFQSTITAVIDFRPFKHGGVRTPAQTSRHDPLAADGWRAFASLAACSMLGVGFTTLGAESLTGRHLMGADLAFWAWFFGASGCARTLTHLMERRGRRHAILRLGCGVVGLMAWSQLSWLMLRYAAQTSGTNAGGITFYATVALVELRWIYRAARDARSDDP